MLKQTTSASDSGSVIIRNALIPVSGTGSLVEKDILIVNGVVAQIEDTGIQVPKSITEVTARGQAVIPGFVNAHTHSNFAFDRGYGGLWSLELHLNSADGFNYGAHLDDLRLSAKLCAADMIRHGCTAAYDMVLQTPITSPEGMEAIADGYRSAGMKVVVAATVTDKTFWESMPGLIGSMSADDKAWISKISAISTDDHLKSLRSALNAWSLDTSKARLALAPSVPLLCSDELLIGIGHLAQEFSVPMQTHLAESKVQSVLSQQRWGMSLTKYLSKIGFFEGDVSAAHAIWLSPDDIQVLAENNVAVAHNPASNMRLGNGVAPVWDMLKAGVTVGIGTDACSCSDQQNMIEAMRQASYCSRIRGADINNWLSAEQTFIMATESSAQVLGFPDIGRLEVGYRADLSFIDLKDLAYLPLNNFWNQLVFSESGRGVKKVMVDGQIIYENGQFKLFDYDDLRQEVLDANKRLKQNYGERRKRFESLESVVSLFCAGLNKAPFAVNQYIQGSNNI